MFAKNHRKKSVVESKVQGALAFRVVLHFCLFIVVGAAFGLFLQVLADPFRPMSQQFDSFWSSNGPYLLSLICMLPIFVRDTLKMSNRIAGPIVRLRKTIRQLADGDQNVEPLKFRKGDHWSDLPESFNAMIRRFGGDFDETVDSTDDGEDAAGSAPSSEDIEELVATVR